MFPATHRGADTAPTLSDESEIWDDEPQPPPRRRRRLLDDYRPKIKHSKQDAWEDNEADDAAADDDDPGKASNGGDDKNAGRPVNDGNNGDNTMDMEPTTGGNDDDQDHVADIAESDEKAGAGALLDVYLSNAMRSSPCAAAAVQSMASKCLQCGLHIDDGVRSCVCVACRWARVHIDCYRQANALHYSDAETTSWQCPKCRSCSHCNDTLYRGILYKCYICQGYFHTQCNVFGRIAVPICSAVERFCCAQCTENRHRMRLEQLYGRAQAADGDVDGSVSRGSRSSASPSSVVPSTQSSSISRHGGGAHSPSQRSDIGSSVVVVEAAVDVVVVDDSTERDRIAVRLPGPPPSIPVPAPSINRNPYNIPANRLPLPCIGDEERLARMYPEWNGYSPFGACYSHVVPDVRHWSVDEVCDYLGQAVPARVVDTLREERFDGCALLMVTRSTVMRLTRLKLGMRLTLYMHVVRLQTRCNDFRLCYPTT